MTALKLESEVMSLYDRFKEDILFMLAAFLFTVPTVFLLIPQLLQTWFIYSVIIINFGLFSIMILVIMSLYQRTLTVRLGISKIGHMLDKMIFNEKKETERKETTRKETMGEKETSEIENP